jgi:acyl carrier protein
MKEQVYQIFANVFDMPVSSVTDDLSPSNFDKWDSIMHLTLISDLEMGLDISFEPEEIERMDSLADVLKEINNKTNH